MTPTNGWTCYESECIYLCGDGKVSEAETCDDGTNDDQGCTGNCKGIREGYDCQGGDLNSATICKEICGDGLNVGNEKCDDGNTVSGDGCQGDCKTTETNWSCEFKRGSTGISEILKSKPYDTFC